MEGQRWRNRDGEMERVKKVLPAHPSGEARGRATLAGQEEGESELIRRKHKNGC